MGFTLRAVNLQSSGSAITSIADGRGMIAEVLMVDFGVRLSMESGDVMADCGLRIELGPQSTMQSSIINLNRHSQSSLSIVTLNRHSQSSLSIVTLNPQSTIKKSAIAIPQSAIRSAR
jgi:hypothetical protein